jgi:phosphohistidine swiveling domain-containing protein
MSKLASKGQTLLQLEGRLEKFHVPELAVYRVDSYALKRDDVSAQIRARFGERAVAVRSSAVDEDRLNTTMAGAYDSVLNVPANCKEAIEGAIEAVIASYSRSGGHEGRDEFIVQEMVQRVSMSGVVFTHDLNFGVPYYVVNYDDVSGSTSSVTAGDGAYSNRTLYAHRTAVGELRSQRFKRLLAAVQELETVLGSQFLDIEFALGEDLTPYLFQVRAITTQSNWNRGITNRIDAALAGIQRFVRNRFQPFPGVFGRTSIFGQMPDWNPAELIGRAPRALSRTLYETLITDRAWREARGEMGYAVPHGQPLMVSLAGQPFVDARLSFHSYLPAELPPEVAEKLVNAWLDRLQRCPELHDKVEFDVAITAYAFDIDRRIDEQVGSALSPSERSAFKNALRNQLKALLADGPQGGISGAMARIEHLVSRQKSEIMCAAKANIGILNEVMERVIRYGTIPFAILARHAFIAKALLQSMVHLRVLTAEEMNLFQTSMQTVASDLVEDMRSLQGGELDAGVFMERYGHLRPGTYDILSKRYDQMDGFSEVKLTMKVYESPPAFKLDAAHTQKIGALLEEHGLAEWNADGLIYYIQRAIVGREYAKFVFTRFVSGMLELIAAFGEENGLSRDELSHLSIQDFFEVSRGSLTRSIEDELRQRSEQAAEHHAVTVAIRLPQVLFDEAGVYIVPFQVSNPNFITHKAISAPAVILDMETSVSPDLSGKIVLIEGADPGFDWIFSQPIAGLITKYGGANSHMAIRCAEFGIPAAIGCGEQRFEHLLHAGRISLDCATGVINLLQ